MLKYDLHCHSNCSDGIYSPEELLEKAKTAGLAGLAITDHNTVAAYNKKLFEKANELGLVLGIGVEFSAQIDGVSVHILGYNFDYQNPHILAFCENYKKIREIRNKKIIDNLVRVGIPITYSELLDEKSLSPGRANIARVLVKKGYIKTIQEAFNLYLGDGKSCYVAEHDILGDEILNLIREAGGKSFLAHPYNFKNKKLLGSILNHNFDGIECYYKLVQKTEAENMVGIAKKRGLLISGGSDFHGDEENSNFLGSSWVEENYFRAIFF